MYNHKIIKRSIDYTHEEVSFMSEIYFTIAGTNHWHGQEFIEPQMKVKLVKEPDNEVDSEAIKVEMPGI